MWVVSYQCDATVNNYTYNYENKKDKLIIPLAKTLGRPCLKYLVQDKSHISKINSNWTRWKKRRFNQGRKEMTRKILKVSWIIWAWKETLEGIWLLTRGTSSIEVWQNGERKS